MFQAVHKPLKSVQKAFSDLLAPIVGKPALTCALVLMGTYASFDFPAYAPALLFTLAIANHFFPRSRQWVVFLSLAAGIVSYDFANGGSWSFLPTLGNRSTYEHGQQVPPKDGCGRVESVIRRAKGNAYIIKTSVGNETYRLRIAERKMQSKPKVKKNTSKIQSPMVFADTASAGQPLDLYSVTSEPIVAPPWATKATTARAVNPGDTLCYNASWYPVSPPRVPGAFDTRGWLKSQGFAAYGRFNDYKIIGSSWIPERTFANFRKWIESRFADYLDPAETGLLLGLLAGDRSGIPEALRSDFQRSGLVHVLAISGFHVVLLAGILMIFLKATGLPLRAVRIIAVALLFLYIPVTGGSPAVRRAVLMFSVPQIGALFQRPANTMNSLGVALILILLPEPGILWNPGFQLSVAATAGILIGSPLNPFANFPESLKRNKLWNTLRAFAIDPTYVTLCATLATAPFLVHHFKTLSPMAWLGNIVVVPGISWGMQAGLFALISPIDFLREHFCYAASFFLRLASLLTRLISDSSIASVTIGPFSPAILLLIGFALTFIPAIRRNRIARIYCVSCLALFAGLFCYNSYAKAMHPTWKLTTIDVGQGDSHLIEAPSGRHFLVDAGDNSRQDSGKDIIVPFLHHIGVRELDALIITHPDKDHFGGAKSILKTFPVRELWASDCAIKERKPEWQQVIQEARKRNIPIRKIHRGILWKETYFEMRTIHPRNDICVDANEGSITLRLKGLGHSAVLTGDLTVKGEKEIMKTDAYLKSDVLKLGHHGSKTSSSVPFLNAVNPSYALIPSGKNNRFRHPSKEVVQRLDSLNIPYINTAERGSISITFSEDTTIIQTMLE
jgi:competence protein ComEC